MAYSYEILPGTKHFRLLHLAPGHGNSALKASLATYELESCCEFEALSYVWGQPDSDETLRVNDRDLFISKNLHTILLQLRLPEVARTLWIDAICVDQGNTAEKNNQVALMGQIYYQAVTVLCWLGQLTTHRLWALKYFQNIANASGSYIKPDELEYEWTLDSLDEMLLPGVGADEVLETARAARVEAIYESEWFTRLWVVQEVTIARNPKILCGSIEMSWIDFETATRIIACCCKRTLKIWKELLSINEVWELLVLRGTYKMNMRPIGSSGPVIFHVDQPWTIGQIVWRMRFKKCKDNKDRIYALLSLTASGNSLKILPKFSIVPDYSKPVEWVYHQFWKHFGGCTSLFWAGLSRRPASERTEATAAFFDNVSKGLRHDFLPSWVPDLRHYPGNRWSPIFEQFYNTSTPFHHLQCAAPKEGPGMLMIRGHRFDVVERVFSCHEQQNSFLITRNIISSLLSLKSEYGPYPTGQNWIEALGSTLITDETVDHSHPLQKQMTKVGSKIRLSNHEIQRLWKIYRETFLADNGSMWNSVCAIIKSRKTVHFDHNVELTHEGQVIWALHSWLAIVLQNHCFMITKHGYLGLAPPDTMVGDVVVAYGGPSVPFVVRDTSTAAYGELKIAGLRGHIVPSDVGTPLSRLLGPCYVQGIMRGELLNEEKWKTQLEWEIDDFGTTPKPTLCLI